MSYPKIWRAGREDDPMGFQTLTLGTQDDVDQRLLLQERVKDAQDGRVVVVPLETVLLLVGHAELIDDDRPSQRERRYIRRVRQLIGLFEAE